MPQVNTKEKSLRSKRVASRIQELLAHALAELTTDTGNLVTVSRVDMSPDMRHAKIWVSVVGGSETETMSLIKRHIYGLQGEVNRNLFMKIIPRLDFRLDTSPRDAQHMAEMLKNLRDQ